MFSNIVNNLYKTSTYIQSNTPLNRAMMEGGGVEVPFIIMANNKDERIERAIRMNLFMLASFVAPVVSMPYLNRFFLKKEGLENNKEFSILKLSKKYLVSDGLIPEGIEKLKEDFKDNKKINIDEMNRYFDNMLKTKDLRKKLIKVHKNVFLTDFLIASLLAVSIPWVSNHITAKRTNRLGYVGEFAIADKNYTNKMTSKHEKNKKIKTAIAYASSITAAFSTAKILQNAMGKPVEKLGKAGKFLKKNINLFDYKNAIYMSKMSYFTVMLTGDLPSFLLACRDKHELKMRLTSWIFHLGMLFGFDFLLNNVTGRLCDKYLHTTLMDRENFHNKGKFNKLFMNTNSFEQLNKMKNVSPLTKKIALGLYWGNLAATAAFLGYGVCKITNMNMRKDVKNDLKNQQREDISKIFFKE